MATELTFIHPLTDGDYAELEQNARPEDRREVERLAPGRTISAAARDGAARGEAFGVRYGDDLVAIAGVVAEPHGGATPWMLCTAAIARCPLAALRASRRIVAGWLGRYGYLANGLDPDHRTARRFVQALGFHVAEEPFYTLRGVPVLWFQKKRGPDV